MSKMISVASGFQYSINIGYDLNNTDKLKNFIPTQSALQLLEEILNSTFSSSTERSRILIGAYGKGKSHIILMILSVLLKRDLNLFEKTLPKIQDNPKLFQLIQNYYSSDNKILPVVITGSNTSLTQAFILALQRTLSENGMLDVMPETNYHAAITVINRWKKDFPETYKQFEAAIEEPINNFVDKLENFNINSYETFERIYPTLTAGSIFNPFLGFDVVELYESVAKSIKAQGYTGLYVVYDEFSKFLEANIEKASVSDTKMLQDFAEKCNRSGEIQMHLMLISHKEISNYIDKLPKQKVDGWRGVSERFKHIHLSNNFSQVYEVIASVIQKDPIAWESFTNLYAKDFESLLKKYQNHPLFSDHDTELSTVIYGCYPLHPVSTFILPRLSEKVAQNERTLFTFLSAEGVSTLHAFLAEAPDSCFSLLTPDIIYDYFEPLFKKESYGGDIYNQYILTEKILTELVPLSLEAKIVKTISLIYILGQHERLKPTKEELINIYTPSFSIEEINDAIDNLIENKYVVYLKQSNNYLRLKQSSGVDILSKISDYVESHASKLFVKDILNRANFDLFMYPSRYNDEHDMTRYFSFVFIDESEVTNETNWEVKSESYAGDGIVFAIIPNSDLSISNIKNSLLLTSKNASRNVFVLPKHYLDIEKIAYQYQAVFSLKAEASNDPILYDEYEVIYEDLQEVINQFVSGYTHPETFKSDYIYNGEQVSVNRKSALTELLSTICDQVYSLTPVISNEALNKDEITSIANNSRSKIITALLRNQLEPSLGLTGTGQDVSIMRSTLVRTGILKDAYGNPYIDLHPSDKNIENMLSVISDFVVNARTSNPQPFSVLYSRLISPSGHIGLRKGVIPVYLAAVLSEYRRQLVITDKFGQVPISADTLQQINADPQGFFLSYVDWSADKEELIDHLSREFSEYIVESEKNANTYDYVVNAMKRWMMSLPKYSKECKVLPNGKKIDERYTAFLKALRQTTSGYELLFEKLPKVFGYEKNVSVGMSENIASAKLFYDRLIRGLLQSLGAKIKNIFMLSQNVAQASKMSLASTIQDWCESVDEGAFTHLFPDGAEKCLTLLKSVSNDEQLFVARLAKAETGLRIEDWDRNTISAFLEKLQQHKATIEAYHSSVSIENSTAPISDYQITFHDEAGNAVTKSFERIQTSVRSKLLYNQITHSLQAMGQSITAQEKRQVLIEILKELC